MTLQRGRQPPRPKVTLQVRAPFPEDAQRAVLKPKKGNGLEPIRLRADGIGSQFVIQSFKDPPSRFAGDAIRISISLLPLRRLIGPNEQAKALYHTVVGSPAGSRPAHILGKPSGLSGSKKT